LKCMMDTKHGFRGSYNDTIYQSLQMRDALWNKHRASFYRAATAQTHPHIFAGESARAVVAGRSLLYQQWARFQKFPWRHTIFDTSTLYGHWWTHIIVVCSVSICSNCNTVSVLPQKRVHNSCFGETIPLSLKRIDRIFVL